MFTVKFLMVFTLLSLYGQLSWSWCHNTPDNPEDICRKSAALLNGNNNISVTDTYRVKQCLKVINEDGIATNCNYQNNPALRAGEATQQSIAASASDSTSVKDTAQSAGNSSAAASQTFTQAQTRCNNTLADANIDCGKAKEQLEQQISECAKLQCPNGPPAQAGISRCQQICKDALAKLQEVQEGFATLANQFIMNASSGAATTSSALTQNEEIVQIVEQSTANEGPGSTEPRVPNAAPSAEQPTASSTSQPPSPRSPATTTTCPSMADARGQCPPGCTPHRCNGTAMFTCCTLSIDTSGL